MALFVIEIYSTLKSRVGCEWRWLSAPEEWLCRHGLIVSHHAARELLRDNKRNMLKGYHEDFVERSIRCRQ